MVQHSSNNTHLGWLAALLAPIALVCSCHRDPSSNSPDTGVSASLARFCAELAGAWDAAAGHCTLTRVSAEGTHVEVNAAYPADLVDDPTAGPVLKSFVRKFFDHYGTPDDRGDGDATLQYSVYTQPPATKSVVFQGDWYYKSMPHPNEDITTFTFDLFQHKQLQLTDLFCPGIDPLKAVPPIARREVQQQLAHTGIPVERFEPGDRGGFADDYQAWALDGDSLVLYMPAARGPGGMPPGFVHPRIALSRMHSMLRGDGCPK